jgi:hypothetical protein
MIMSTESTLQKLSGNVNENGLATSDIERKHDAIAEIAYRKAEQRGFEPGHDVKDWLEAESEVLGSWFINYSSQED